MSTDLDPTEFRRCMKVVPGTVSVITSGEAGSRTGLTATAVCSVSDTPPMLLVCVNGHASAHPVIRDTGRFAVNVLADSHRDLACRFAGQHGVDGEDRFVDAQWITSSSGASVLETAAATFECVLEAEYRHGSHSIFIGRVEAATSRESPIPLIYLNGGFGTFVELSASL